MNYAGHEQLRAEVADVANNMCDLRATLNGMEHRYCSAALFFAPKIKKNCTDKTCAIALCKIDC
ncbi:hypothetical protein [Raoultella ornithinolytica]|uniref:hypothetical protein n=1 Tax=Raoultella ornithinolytica TaxID=54291 RepID=UPI001BAE3FBD